MIDPVIGRAAIRLTVAPGLYGTLSLVAAGRSLVIDFYASRVRGVSFGDLIVWYGEPYAGPWYVELESINGVTVLAERHLVELLDGATLRQPGPHGTGIQRFRSPDRMPGSTSLTDISLAVDEVPATTLEPCQVRLAGEHSGRPPAGP